MKWRRLAGVLLAASSGCKALGAVVVVASDSGGAIDEDVAPLGIDSSTANRDSSADARSPTLDVSDAGAADAEDALAQSRADGYADAANESSADVACAPVDPALSALSSRGVAVSPDRTTFGTHVRVYYVTAGGTLRMELRTASLARSCSVDLGAPPDSTLVGTPAVAHRREHVFVAARNRAGVLEYWGRFSTNARDASCGTVMLPWERLPLPPGGALLQTAPAALLMADAAPDTPVFVAGQIDGGSVYITDRSTSLNGPTGAWSAPRVFAPTPPCRSIGARLRLEPLGPNRAQMYSLQTDSRGGYSFAVWQWSIGAGASQYPSEYLGSTRPTAPVAGHLWVSSRDFGYVQTVAVGGDIFARGYGFAVDHINHYYDPIWISPPAAAASARVSSLLVVNGPGTELWQGMDGDLYVIAQFSNDPSVLHFAVASADEWFDPGLPVVWQTSGDRLE